LQEISTRSEGNKVKFNKIIVCLGFSLLFFLGSDFALAESHANQQPVKVGFVLCGTISDNGWNKANNDGRLYLEKSMNGKVKTVFAEKIPEGSDAGRVMEKMIAQGVKVIFTPCYGYFEIVQQVAKRHPDVIFMQINRVNEKKAANIGIFAPSYHEPLYSAGIVAGRMTKTNKMGFIVGHAVPNILACVNAFTLGAQSVNPKTTVRLVCTNSWDNPPIEAEATKALAESGVDVIVSNLDTSLTVSKAAEKAKIYTIAIHSDLKKEVPKAWLTGQVWNFGPLYKKIVESIIDGSWKPESKYYRAKDGYVSLASFGEAVPAKVQKEALDSFEKIKEEKIDIFAGPIKDCNGKLRIPSGKTADNHCIEQMNWVVPGVEGYSAK